MSSSQRNNFASWHLCSRGATINFRHNYLFQSNKLKCHDVTWLNELKVTWQLNQSPGKRNISVRCNHSCSILWKCHWQLSIRTIILPLDCPRSGTFEYEGWLVSHWHSQFFYGSFHKYLSCFELLKRCCLKMAAQQERFSSVEFNPYGMGAISMRLSGKFDPAVQGLYQVFVKTNALYPQYSVTLG